MQENNENFEIILKCLMKNENKTPVKELNTKNFKKWIALKRQQSAENSS